MADNTNSPLAIRAQIGTLASLATADKTDVVTAINEVALGHIVKLASDGTLTITGDPTGTAAEKFVAVQTAIEALTDGEHLFLPDWKCETAGQNISLSNVDDLLIDVGDCEFLMTGEQTSNFIIKFYNCNYCTLRNPRIDGNLDVPTGNKYCYGIYIDECEGFIIENPDVRNIGQYISWTGNVSFSGTTITNVDGAGNPFPVMQTSGTHVQPTTGTNSSASFTITASSTTSITTSETSVTAGSASLTLIFATAGHGIVIHGGARNKIIGGRTKNNSYINVYDAGCFSLDIIDHDIIYDSSDDVGGNRIPLQGYGRSFNSSTLAANGFESIDRTTVRGGTWHGDGSLTEYGSTKGAGFNVNTVTAGTVGSYDFSITNVVLTSGVATVTVSSAHGLTAGRRIKIADCSDERFNGKHVVTSAGSTTLLFSLDLDDVGTAAATGTVFSGYRGRVEFINVTIHTEGTDEKQNVGKIETAEDVLFSGVRSLSKNVAHAVSVHLMPNGGTVTVENCDFESGAINCYLLSTSYNGRLIIRNTKFRDCATNSLNASNKHAITAAVGSIAVSCDRDTEFYNVNESTAYFLYRIAYPNSRGTSFFDCHINFNDATTVCRVFLNPGEFGNIKLGDNFRVTQRNSQNIWLAVDGYSTTGNQRLSITRQDGCGHFDSLKSLWWTGQTGTVGYSTAPAFSANTHMFRTGGNPFPYVYGKLGDRIINDNWAVNGLPREWVHNGTLWVEAGPRSRMYVTTIAGEYFPRVGEIVSNKEVVGLDPLFQIVKVAGGYAVPWSTKAYFLGEFCLGDSGTKIYICVTAGTATGSEPTGTGTALGTGAIFDYLCPLAVLVDSADVWP